MPEQTGYVERLAEVLRANGLTDKPGEYDSSIHSWRCEHPSRYGPCDCFAKLVHDLSAVLADQRAVWEAEARGKLATEAEARISAMRSPERFTNDLAMRQWSRGARQALATVRDLATGEGGGQE